MDQDDRRIAELLEDQEMVSRSFSDMIAKWFDGIGTTPNRLTAWRIVLSLPMCLCFTLAGAYRENTLFWAIWLIAGTLLYIHCALLDFFDGALARYQKRTYAIPDVPEDEEYALSFWQRLNLRGSSHYGAILDPFSDKTMYFGAVFPLGWHVVNHLLLWASLCVALILTLIRFRAIRRALEFAGKGAANRFGKFKIWFEVLVIASLVLIPRGALQELIANLAVGIALVIGCLSLTGHAWLGIKKAAVLRKAAATHRRNRS